MEIFESTEFGAIRTVVDESGSVLFCGSDVAKALGYQKPQNAIRMHCRRSAPKTASRKRIVILHSASGPQHTTYQRQDLIFRNR